MNEGKHLVVKSIPILRMDCPTCIPALENEVKKLRGVEEVRGSYMTKTLKVTYDPDVVKLADIEAAIEGVGYRVAYKSYPGFASRLKDLIKKEKSSSVITISDSEFTGKVLHAPKPVAVLFSSPACPLCRILKTTYDEAAATLQGKNDLFEMDIGATETWRNYGIMLVPTILIFRDGEVKARLTTLPKKEEIERALGALSVKD